MSQEEGHTTREQETLAAAQQALRLVSLTIPHLSGLALHVRPQPEWRVRTAGIFASGRMPVNPEWFLKLERMDQAFVMAHELMHLALQSHARQGDTDGLLFNIAHDYIINDMLREVMGGDGPEGILIWKDARHLSAEAIVKVLQEHEELGYPPIPVPGWGNVKGKEEAPSAMGEALRKAGLAPDEAAAGAEVVEEELLSEAQERAWFPEKKALGKQQEEVQREVAKALALERLWKELNEQRSPHPPGTEPGRATALVEAFESLYHPPWEQVLQRWMEAVMPTTRSYARPSRRGQYGSNLVRPGRKREGWILHLILDTSGSMSYVQKYILGTIARFCKEMNVEQVRLLQCDTEVTRDEYLTPEQLAQFEIAGYGGSNMAPAMDYLADDLEVEAAVVITDGWIDYPSYPMPYEVLWTITSNRTDFSPPYGQVLNIAPYLVKRET